MVVLVFVVGVSLFLSLFFGGVSWVLFLSFPVRRFWRLLLVLRFFAAVFCGLLSGLFPVWSPSVLSGLFLSLVAFRRSGLLVLACPALFGGVGRRGLCRFPSLVSGGCPVPRSVSFPSVGFCGSRRLSGSAASLAGRVAGSVSACGVPVSVGCAAGADAAVRSACPSAVVLSVASGRFGSGRSAFARRSAALVSSLPSGSAFVGFVSSPCPAVVSPSPSPSRCFCGGGSGSWASLALAAGLGLAVFVFWAGSGAFPAPAWGGSWSPVSSGVFAGSFRFVASPALF